MRERERYEGSYLHGSQSLHTLLGQFSLSLCDILGECVGLLGKGDTELLVGLLLGHLVRQFLLSLGDCVQHLAPLVIHQLSRENTVLVNGGFGG